MTTAIANPIQKHLQSKQFAEQRLWTMRNGIFYTEVDGKLISEETFNNLYPVYNPMAFVKTRENIDGTKAFLRD